MKITAVETTQVEEYSNLLWVRLVTDEGLTGLGETFRNPNATAAYIHETCAPYLLGKDPLQLERHSDALLRKVGNHFNGFPTRSVEIRGNSAVDIALWDLVGKALNQPLYQLLGGLTRDRIRIYNTCAGYTYNSRVRADINSERMSRDDKPSARDLNRPYEDLQAQLHRPAELAQELLAEGITGMKIWPFDGFALRTDGHYISGPDLKKAIQPVAEIRKAVDDQMDIMIEFHNLWQLPAALEIAHALADYNVFWLEDPIPMQNFDDLALYQRSVKSRVCGSENLGTRPWYREMFQRQAIDVAHFDMGWIGGISEGRRIAALASAFDRPIAPHDCTGPVILTANVHLLVSQPNALIAETVRAHYRSYYQDCVTALPRIENGMIYPLTGPGLGAELSPDLLARDDLTVRRTQ